LTEYKLVLLLLLGMEKASMSMGNYLSIETRKKNQHVGTMKWITLHSADITRCTQLRVYEGYCLYAEQGINPLTLNLQTLMQAKGN